MRKMREDKLIQRNQSTFGQLIWTHRRLKNLRQRDVAEQLRFECGQFISNVERGISRFPTARLFALCEVLEITHENAVNAILEDKKRTLMKALIR